METYGMREDRFILVNVFEIFLVRGGGEGSDEERDMPLNTRREGYGPYNGSGAKYMASPLARMIDSQIARGLWNCRGGGGRMKEFRR